MKLVKLGTTSLAPNCARSQTAYSEDSTSKALVLLNCSFKAVRIGVLLLLGRAQFFKHPLNLGRTQAPSNHAPQSVYQIESPFFDVVLAVHRDGDTVKLASLVRFELTSPNGNTLRRSPTADSFINLVGVYGHCDSQGSGHSPSSVVSSEVAQFRHWTCQPLSHRRNAFPGVGFERTQTLADGAYGVMVGCKTRSQLLSTKSELRSAHLAVPVSSRARLPVAPRPLRR